MGGSPLRLRFFLAALALACFAPCPMAQAVSPPPDGGYPGGNTAEGNNALLNLTTGQFNTAVGLFSLALNTQGNSNTGVGASALRNNTSGNENTATGFYALSFNNTGFGNTANGVLALYNNTTGRDNVANGDRALVSNTTGNFNTATGSSALSDNTTGSENIAVGHNALVENTTGSENIAIGHFAGRALTTGDNNIDIRETGHTADEANTIRIGTTRDVSDTPPRYFQDRTFIAGIYGITTANTAIPVMIDSAGQLGTMSSSRRFKKEIKAMDKASETILALKPVTFHYKSDNTNTPQFGLIAEEVAQVNPDLVITGRDGKPYTVRYEAVNAMLLNEFLKEHRKVEEQGATIARQQASIAELKSTVAQQQKGMEVLTAQLKEQAAQIQKVSAQLEASKPASQVVNNP